MSAFRCHRSGRRQSYYGTVQGTLQHGVEVRRDKRREHMSDKTTPRIGTRPFSGRNAYPILTVGKVEVEYGLPACYAKDRDYASPSTALFNSKKTKYGEHFHSKVCNDRLLQRGTYQFHPESGLQACEHQVPQWSPFQ
jgi:imidazoleglycerol phosphate synthase glutamine amidotransferase subunit HisH